MSNWRNDVRPEWQFALGVAILAIVWWPGMNYFGFCRGSLSFPTDRE
jgi:hypothetical protein